MKPTRSTKYRIYRRSKYRFPTTFPGQAGGNVQIGHVRAEKDIRGQIGRDFKEGTRTQHSFSQWIWKEPK